MSVFPFITPPSSTEDSTTALPMFREYAYDYENNCLLLHNGNTYLVEGNEALRIWIFKALATERFRYTAYDAAFGSEIDTLPGLSLNDEIAHSELKRFITEAIMVNPYIVELSNFQFTRTLSGTMVEFDCETVYGQEHFTWQSEGVNLYGI